MSKQAKPAAAAADEATAKTVTGKVISNKMQKTITVVVERYEPHPRYGKYLRRTTQLLAHDENNESREGDVVAIQECRPLSRRKNFRLVRVISRAAQASGETTP
ncbi:MAG TPA: 30S ribosomal protein S17 [Povalibacter sp.]|jgi:small subunit ribosomal protein S17